MNAFKLMGNFAHAVAAVVCPFNPGHPLWGGSFGGLNYDSLKKGAALVFMYAACCKLMRERAH